MLNHYSYINQNKISRVPQGAALFELSILLLKQQFFCPTFIFRYVKMIERVKITMNINLISNILINMFQSILLIVFSCLYIQNGRRKLMLGFLFSIILCLEVTIFNYFAVYESLLSGCYILTVLLFMYLIDGTNIWNSLVFDLLMFIVLTVSADLTLFFLSLSEHQNIAEYVTLNTNILLRSTICTLIFAVLVGIIIAFSKTINFVKTKYDWLFSLIFLIIYVSIASTTYIVFNYSIYSAYIIIGDITELVVAIVLYYLFCLNASDHEKEKEYMLLNTQLEAVKQLADEKNSNDQEIRIIKHDLENQYQILDSYLEKGDIASCRDIIHQYETKLEDMPINVHTGFTAIDAILSIKLSAARKDGIDTFSSVSISQLSKEKEYCIAALLANLLDNAHENISKANKQIIVKIWQDDKIIIKVENTTDNLSGSLRTSKSDPINHGLGLQSVKSLINRYKGSIDIIQDSGRFFVVIHI